MFSRVTGRVEELNLQQFRTDDHSDHLLQQNIPDLDLRKQL